MLATVEVKDRLVGSVYLNGSARQVATLQVLYHQEPEPARGVPFIQVRQWLTAREDSADLVAEWGRVVNDDLVTESAVLPGFWGLAQALTYVHEQLARRA